MSPFYTLKVLLQGAVKNHTDIPRNNEALDKNTEIKKPFRECRDFLETLLKWSGIFWGCNDIIIK